MTTPDSLLLSSRDGAVLRLVLNRARARNALSSALMGELGAALDAAAADRDVRVIVLAAEGPVFSAGHDLKELQGHRADGDKGRAAYAGLFAQCSALMLKIVHCPKPVIAEVAGLATAAGCQLVASCDLVVASDHAGFATPGVDIGLFCSTPMVALSRAIGSKPAMEMLLTGEPIKAEAAKALGLVNRVVPLAELQRETMALAQKIATKPHGTIKTGKAAFYRQREMSLEAAYDYTAKVMTENMLAAEASEGVCAFIEKRDPKWPQ